MKMKFTRTMILALLCVAAAAIPAWAQTATISGKVTDNDKPLAGVQVIYKSANTGRTIKVKTDRKGEFSSIGVPIDVYTVSVADSSGKTIFTQEHVNVGMSGDSANNTLNIDITNGATSTTQGSVVAGNPAGSRTQEFGGPSGTNPSASSKSSGGAKMTKEEREKVEAENTKARSINALIEQAQKAINEKNWKDAEPVLKQMIAAESNRWEFYQALGNAQLNQEEYEDAVASYQKGVDVAQGVVSGALPKDPKNPSMDPVKAKTGIGQMLTAQGNAYLKLKKNPEAVAAFTKAAELSPDPGVAYFNLCATQYNTGNVEGGLAACDKAIAADPKKADAYFIKGSLMVGQGTLDKDGKMKVPAGTEEALKKYLELAPDGPHAPDVKQMLEALGAKIETTYKTRKK